MEAKLLLVGSLADDDGVTSVVSSGATGADVGFVS